MSKIQIVKQKDLKDCGACSLDSIIRFYNGYIPMEKIRLDTNTNKDGTTAFNILEAAKKYGFDVKGIKVDSLDNPNIYLPAIAHIEKNGLKHFVVVYKISQKNVLIMDPAKGKVSMKRGEFEDIFTNVLLLFYPKEKIKVLDKNSGIKELFLRIFKHEKKLIFLLILFNIIYIIISIICSYYLKIGIETKQTLNVIIYLFIFLTIMKILFNHLRLYLENFLEKNIDVLVFQDFLYHLFIIPSRSFSSRSSGEVLTRVKELNNIKNIFIEVFINILLDIFLLIIIVPLLIIMNYKLFLILFFFIIIYIIIGLLTSKTIYNKSYQNISLEQNFNEYLTDGINAYNSIKNINITNYYLNKLEQIQSMHLYDSFLFNKILNNIYLIKDIINELCIFLVNTIGIIMIYKNTFTITNLITFNSLMVFFINPLKNIVDILPKINYLRASIDKINDILVIDEEKVGDLFDNTKTIINGNISVYNLDFSYNNYNTIIQNKSFTIKEGSRVVLKGPSGSGKSTFCKLLVKMYDNYKGIIKIGNYNIKDIPLSILRKNILYISQNESIFNDTIKNNLLMGRDINLSKLNDICKICLIDEILDKKALRMDSLINNGDNYLSGGEMQRIILARALLSDANIIILDESLSEVDYEKERIIINNINNYFQNNTIIYITHKNHDDLFDEIINIGVKNV